MLATDKQIVLLTYTLESLGETQLTSIVNEHRNERRKRRKRTFSDGDEEDVDENIELQLDEDGLLVTSPQKLQFEQLDPPDGRKMDAEESKQTQA